jgi:hypothetical protein
MPKPIQAPFVVSEEELQGAGQAIIDLMKGSPMDWDVRRVRDMVEGAGPGVYGHIPDPERFVRCCIAKGQFDMVKAVLTAGYEPEDSRAREFIAMALCFDGYVNVHCVDIITQWVEENGFGQAVLRANLSNIMTPKGKIMISIGDALKRMPCFQSGHPASGLEVRVLTAFGLEPPAVAEPTEQEIAAAGGGIIVDGEEAMVMG